VGGFWGRCGWFGGGKVVGGGVERERGRGVWAGFGAPPRGGGGGGGLNRDLEV